MSTRKYRGIFSASDDYYDVDWRLSDQHNSTNYFMCKENFSEFDQNNVSEIYSKDQQLQYTLGQLNLPSNLQEGLTIGKERCNVCKDFSENCTCYHNNHAYKNCNCSGNSRKCNCGNVKERLTMNQATVTSNAVLKQSQSAPKANQATVTSNAVLKQSQAAPSIMNPKEVQLLKNLKKLQGSCKMIDDIIRKMDNKLPLSNNDKENIGYLIKTYNL